MLAGEPWDAAVRQLRSVVRGGPDDVEEGAGVVHGEDDRRYHVSGRWGLSGAVDLVKLATVSARGEDDGRQVVLKFFRTEAKWAKECKVLRLMAADAEAPAPHLVEAFKLRPADARAVGNASVHYVLVMEYGMAASLTHRNDSELDKTQLAARLLRCVNALHEAPMHDDDAGSKRSISVHCDLKPSHFLIFGGKRRLVDYGSVCREGAMTDTPEYTHAYCAPEVALAVETRGTVAVTRGVDTWALGLMLYEIFAEEPLMRGCFVPATPTGLVGGGEGGARKEAATAEERFCEMSVEQRGHYVRWLAGGGAEMLRRKLDANAQKRLSSSHRDLIKRMLAVDPTKRAPLSELLRASCLQAYVPRARAPRTRHARRGLRVRAACAEARGPLRATR